ncbi:MAG: DinB family protein [Chloroflexota bacterium]
MTPQQSAVRGQVVSVPARLAEAARAARPEPPAPDAWAPRDIVRHLIAVEEEVWQPRLRQLIAEDEPRWAWVEPDRWQGSPGASLEDLLATYADRRAATVALLDQLGEDGWTKSGVHATFGRLDAAGLMQKALDHDAEHVASLER